MVTGQRAFRGESRASTLAAVVEKDPPSVSTITQDVPPELERLIARCLRKDVQRRSQSMADVKLSLEELGDRLGVGPSHGSCRLGITFIRRDALVAPRGRCRGPHCRRAGLVIAAQRLRRRARRPGTGTGSVQTMGIAMERQIFRRTENLSSTSRIEAERPRSGCSR